MRVLVPNLFNVPFCDFGVGPIDGCLRGLVAYVVSRCERVDGLMLMEISK